MFKILYPYLFAFFMMCLTSCGNSVAASSYQRILPVRIDSTTLKSNKSEELSDLVVKRTETLISNEKSLNIESDTILKSFAYLRKFSVIAGSFSGFENSLIQISRLKTLEYEPFVVKSENEMYRIVVGTFEEKVDADILCFRLENDSIPSWILKK